MARFIAAKSPVAVTGSKVCRTDLSPRGSTGRQILINHARDHTVEEGLDYTAVWNASMIQAAVCLSSAR
jgi:delta(3,5)-delta(2,4)-dienoyl-CoA isomerase